MRPYHSLLVAAASAVDAVVADADDAGLGEIGDAVGGDAGTDALHQCTVVCVHGIDFAIEAS